jgi:hypothetical protein
MAKNPHPWTCDEDGVPKTPSNNWFVAIELTEGGTRTSDQHAITGIQIVKWQEALAEEVHAGRIKGAHLCGIDCAQRWTGKRLMDAIGKEVTPQNEVRKKS